MSIVAPTIRGTSVTTRLAMKMEDSLQAFAIRAACFIRELDVPFSEEFDGHDYDATHVIACLGEEPIGAVRVRWFQSFALTERLAVLQRFRGHNVGQFLLERCRTLAASRGCNTLYAQVLPHDVGYWEKQGWRRLLTEAMSQAGPGQIVSMVRAVDPNEPLPEPERPEVIVLRRDPQFGAASMPKDTIMN